MDNRKDIFSSTNVVGELYLQDLIKLDLFSGPSKLQLDGYSKNGKPLPEQELSSGDVHGQKPSLLDFDLSSLDPFDSSRPHPWKPLISDSVIKDAENQTLAKVANDHVAQSTALGPENLISDCDDLKNGHTSSNPVAKTDNAVATSASGELGFVSQGVRSSTRVKTFTEKGFNYNLDLYSKQFRSAVTSHERCINACQIAIDSGQFQMSELLKFRSDLEKCVLDVSNAFHKLIDLCPGKYEELLVKVLQRESANRTALFNVTEALRTLEANSVSIHSHKSGRESKTGISSCKTRSSGHSHSKSVASMKAEAAAKAASLRTKLKYLDVENEHLAKLEKLRTMRDLESEEAKIYALNDAKLPVCDQLSSTLCKQTNSLVVSQADPMIAKTKQSQFEGDYSKPLDFKTQTQHSENSMFGVTAVVNTQPVNVIPSTANLLDCSSNYFHVEKKSHENSGQQNCTAVNACNSLHVSSCNPLVSISSTQGADNSHVVSHANLPSPVYAHLNPISAVHVQSSNYCVNEPCSGQFEYVGSNSNSQTKISTSVCNSKLDCSAPVFVPQMKLSTTVHQPESPLVSTHNDNNHGHEPVNNSSSFNGISNEFVGGSQSHNVVGDLVKTLSQLVRLCQGGAE